MLEPTVRPIPSSDTEFASAAMGALGRARAAGWADHRLGPALVAELKAIFPRVVARRMASLAGIVDNRITWYVFRDGDGHADTPPPAGQPTTDDLMVGWLTAERAITAAPRDSPERMTRTKAADGARERYQAAIDRSSRAVGD